MLLKVVEGLATVPLPPAAMECPLTMLPQPLHHPTTPLHHLTTPLHLPTALPSRHTAVAVRRLSRSLSPTFPSPTSAPSRQGRFAPRAASSRGCCTRRPASCGRAPTSWRRRPTPWTGLPRPSPLLVPGCLKVVAVVVMEHRPTPMGLRRLRPVMAHHRYRPLGRLG